MPLNWKKPYGEICGSVGPFGSKYEQNGRYFDAAGEFVGPPELEDAFWDDTPAGAVGEAEAQAMKNKIDWLDWLMTADYDALKAQAKEELNIQPVGKMSADTFRKRMYETKYGN